MIELLNLIGKMLESGITWAAIVSVLLGLEKYYDKRRERRLLYLIAKKVGVEWDTPQEELRKMAALSYKKLSISSLRGIIRRRRIVMEKLKSRKFWMTVVATLIPLINEEFKLNLDLETIGLMMAALMAGVAALAHVDAKKILASIKHIKVDPQNVELVYTTYKEALPHLQEIHSSINKLLNDVKRDDASNAFKDAMSTYIQIKAILDNVKQPEPVIAIVDEAVPA